MLKYSSERLVSATAVKVEAEPKGINGTGLGELVSVQNAMVSGGRQAGGT